jgi:TRAP-type C4-dicarboxylate transport system substrate-binding protein
VLWTPFLFRDRAHWARFVASPVLAEMMAPVEQAAGIRWAGYLGPRPPRALSTTRRAVNGPEDLRGLKLRTAEIPPVVDAFRVWGASPTPLRAPEIYNALQTGWWTGRTTR